VAVVVEQAGAGAGQDRSEVDAHRAGEASAQLAAPDRSTRAGRRDATLLATLYDTAARVQELADLTVRDIRVDDPAMAALTGKGRKTRHVPIDASTTALLAAYLAEQQLDRSGLRTIRCSSISTGSNSASSSAATTNSTWVPGSVPPTDLTTCLGFNDLGATAWRSRANCCTADPQVIRRMLNPGVRSDGK
jgi:integrase